MKKITTHNYEAFMLDHFEGTLSKEDSGLLLLFLEDHPSLKEEFYEFEMLNISDFETETLVFENKEEIKQKAELDVLLIGQLEGINTEVENSRLNELLLIVPNAKQEQYSYSKTILSKSEITYPHKSELKKKGIVIPIQFWYSAAAAAIIGFIVLFDFSPASQSQTYQARSIETVVERIAFKPVPVIEQIESTVDTTENTTIAPSISPNAVKINQSIFIAQDVQPTETTPLKDKKEKIKEENPNTNFIADNGATPKKDSVTSTPIIENKQVLPNFENDKALVAQVEDASTKEVSVKEYLQSKAKEKLFKDNTTGSEDLNSNNVIASLADKVNKKTKTEVAYSTSKKEKKKTTHIKIGKFEYYRSKKA